MLTKNAGEQTGQEDEEEAGRKWENSRLPFDPSIVGQESNPKHMYL